MKKLLLLTTLLLTGARCSREPAEPTAPLAGTWTCVKIAYETQPKDHGAITATTAPPAVATRYTFDGNGTLTMYLGTTQTSRSYKYASYTLTLLAPGNPKVYTVQELSAHKLTLVEHLEDNTNTYINTEIYSR